VAEDEARQNAASSSVQPPKDLRREMFLRIVKAMDQQGSGGRRRAADIRISVCMRYRCHATAVIHWLWAPCVQNTYMSSCTKGDRKRGVDGKNGHWCKFFDSTGDQRILITDGSTYVDSQKRNSGYTLAMFFAFLDCVEWKLQVPAVYLFPPLITACIQDMTHYHSIMCSIQSIYKQRFRRRCSIPFCGSRKKPFRAFKDRGCG
jgi:hypothetical protein